MDRRHVYLRALVDRIRLSGSGSGAASTSNAASTFSHYEEKARLPNSHRASQLGSDARFRMALLAELFELALQSDPDELLRVMLGGSAVSLHAPPATVAISPHRDFIEVARRYEIERAYYYFCVDSPAPSLSSTVRALNRRLGALGLGSYSRSAFRQRLSTSIGRLLATHHIGSPSFGKTRGPNAA